MRYYGSYTFEMGVFIVDENYSTLTSPQLSVKNYEETKTLNVDVNVRSDNAYILKATNVEYENGLDILPKEYQQIFSNLKTKNDVISYGEDNFSNFYIPFKIVESNAPTGYKNDRLIFFAKASATFDYDSNNNITGVKINIYRHYEGQNFMTKNDSNFDYSHLIKYTDLINVQDHVARTCGYERSMHYGEIVTTTDDVFGSGCFDVFFFFVNEKGKVKLNITNTVNDTMIYNATNNRNLLYKISVNNAGDIASSNNKITTNIAKGIIVNENSISDNGVYNKTNNTITWTISNIDAGESYNLFYEAFVPIDALVTEEYIGNSYITSDQEQNEIKSGDTIVNLTGEFINTPTTTSKDSSIIQNQDTVTNPQTNVGITGLFIIVFIVFLIALIILQKKKNTFLKRL